MNIPILVNLESPDVRDEKLMAACLKAMGSVGIAAVISDGWIDSGGYWKGYRRWVGSVECFPEEFQPYEDVAGCLLHANAFFRATVPMLGAYGTKWLGRKPILADYKVPAGLPRIIFAGDDVEDWGKW